MCLTRRTRVGRVKRKRPRLYTRVPAASTPDLYKNCLGAASRTRSDFGGWLPKQSAEPSRFAPSTVDYPVETGEHVCTAEPPSPTFSEHYLIQLDGQPLGTDFLPPRSESRVAKRILVRLSYPEKGEFEIAPTVDISCHGARVVSRRFWPPNLRVSVQSISGHLYSRARVAHCQLLTNGSYATGLELFRPSKVWTKFSKAPRR